MKTKALALPLLLVVAATMSVMIMGNAVVEFDGYHDKIDVFFSMIKAEKSNDAIDHLYADNPWLSRASDDVQQLKSHLANTMNLVGKYQGHELLTEKVVADRFVYLKYFVAYDRQPFNFVFEFYKPQDQWIIFGFFFNANIDEEIEEAAQSAYYIDLFTKK